MSRSHAGASWVGAPETAHAHARRRSCSSHLQRRSRCRAANLAQSQPSEQRQARLPRRRQEHVHPSSALGLAAGSAVHALRAVIRAASRRRWVLAACRPTTTSQVRYPGSRRSRRRQARIPRRPRLSEGAQGSRQGALEGKRVAWRQVASPHQCLAGGRRASPPIPHTNGRGYRRREQRGRIGTSHERPAMHDSLRNFVSYRGAVLQRSFG